MKKLILLVVLIITLSITQSCVEAQAGTVEIVSSDEAAAIIKTQSAQLVDVRSKDQFDAGHISGAINIPVDSENLNEIIAGLNDKEPVLVYCNGGRESAQCAKILEDKGFTKIFDLDGGLSKWTTSGREVVLKTKE
ncbi:rhodanese-like domain-containing protein [Nonlabens mediterrranea]|uniref:Rhodanese-like domain-containing protein n=1 Tax=Nonlabens mediterrranea TaxID=1419947 RepID=A0ABS0A1C5_9FLAO|nr:rhodanese-like domain-containing protein [Nonlabens mediterrranea]MBF4984217.1 rhodanese-like domain-containing protein [Nonlabens mediterrranea]